jgi:hypothetical protein
MTENENKPEAKLYVAQNATTRSENTVKQDSVNSHSPCLFVGRFQP